MSRFIETIACEDGEYPLLDHHQKRVNETFSEFFPKKPPILLKETTSQIRPSGRNKVRIIYDEEVRLVEHATYQPKKVNSIKIVEVDTKYHYKFEDRHDLKRYFSRRAGCDDILMIHNGQITDSYYANVCFWDGQHWVTPKSHLLNGVKRQYLLKTHRIKEAAITLKDIPDFQKITLINAMLNPGEISIPTSSIVD